jgi:hypothetical protein
MTDSRRPKRIRTGSLNALKRRVWASVLAAEDLLSHDDPQTRLRAVHAVSQAAACYRAVYADADLDARLAALEARAEGKAS